MFEKISTLLGIKKEAKKNFVRRSILIIDDNETDLALVRKTVENIGHNALTAQNGKDGFAMARSEKPDLILSDCRMPEMDGIEMCKRLKEDDTTKNIPIVFLTGVDSPANVVECFDMEVHNYICKPINPKILTSQITSIFEECFS